MSETRQQDHVSAPEEKARPLGERLRGSRFRAWRNTLGSMLLVLAGLGTTLVAVIARRTEDVELATIAAIASLLIVLLIIIFVLPPLVRSARAEVQRLNLPLEVTLGGLIFLGILSIVAFAAWNTGNNLLFLIFSILVSTLFVSWAAARASLRDLIVSARFPDHIFAGEPAPVIVTLRNTKRLLPSFSIMVEARSQTSHTSRKNTKPRLRASKRALAYFMYVPHRAAAEQRVEQLFPKRGHHLIIGFELSTRFPFGFFRRRRRLRARNVDIVVYPKPEPISDELHLLPMNAGRLASVRRGAGHDLLSLRDYQPQDDLRHIDWKATARSHRLTVREFTAEDERRVTIALDTQVLSEAEEKDFAARFERGVTLGASLLAHFIDERAEVRLVLGQEQGRYGVGREHLYACLRRLALVVPQSVVQGDGQAQNAGASIASEDEPLADAHYVILLTTASPGSIPSNVWRTSHVIYL
ncbi:MAG TPA: DUF58 domain-containing protein [Pyrinomonadaceae bacterium]|jgi:uncharacterized protein (DUF58 family)